MGRTVDSLDSFTKIILNDLNRNDNSTLFFRGHPSKDYSLVPGLYRPPYFHDVEDTIYKEMLLHHPREFLEDSSALERLVRMQHYFAPTRLLDLTESAFVALFFACLDAPDERVSQTGEVLAMAIPNQDICHYSSDKVSILANLAGRPILDKEKIVKSSKYFANKIDRGADLRENIKRFNGKDHVARLLHDIRQERPHFKDVINPRDIRRTACVRVKRNNERILAQHGAFLLFGLGDSVREPSLIPDTWRLTARTEGRRIYISRDAKAEILRQLHHMMIRKDTLMPGLESTADYLRRKYKPEPGS